jgi:uncharacterized protein DUF5659
MIDQTYSTSDLYWAAALVASGFPMLDITSARGQTFWHFERTDSMNGLRIHWANKTLQVSAREYADALTMLKSSVIREPRRAVGAGWREG